LKRNSVCSNILLLCWNFYLQSSLNSILQQKKDSYAFDLDAEVDTIPESTDSEQQPDYIDDGFGAIEDDDDDNDHIRMSIQYT